jgi:primosomal replication protein N
VNHVVLSAGIVEAKPLRYTPAGLPFSGFLATPRNGKNAVLHIQDIQQN